MLEIQCNPKIKAEHLARKAIVYLRQSSDKQVRKNKESQRLQYEVAERMHALGWKEVESSIAILDPAQRSLPRAAKDLNACSARWR